MPVLRHKSGVKKNLSGTSHISYSQTSKRSHSKIISEMRDRLEKKERNFPRVAQTICCKTDRKLRWGVKSYTISSSLRLESHCKMSNWLPESIWLLFQDRPKRFRRRPFNQLHWIECLRMRFIFDISSNVIIKPLTTGFVQGRGIVLRTQFTELTDGLSCQIMAYVGAKKPKWDSALFHLYQQLAHLMKTELI